jgi:hypothetical protein
MEGGIMRRVLRIMEVLDSFLEDLGLEEGN